MTFTQLHEILDDENKKLSPAELKQVIYKLKQDAFNEMRKTRIASRDYIWYEGEQNAFQIVLDLLEHLDKPDFETFGDKISEILEGVNDIFPKLDYGEYSWLFNEISELPHTVANLINDNYINCLIFSALQVSLPALFGVIQTERSRKPTQCR